MVNEIPKAFKANSGVVAPVPPFSIGNIPVIPEFISKVPFKPGMPCSPCLPCIPCSPWGPCIPYWPCIPWIRCSPWGPCMPWGPIGAIKLEEVPFE